MCVCVCEADGKHSVSSAIMLSLDVRVCARVCARVFVCVFVCVRFCVRVCVYVRGDGQRHFEL
jgi:hypothetical protein